METSITRRRFLAAACGVSAAGSVSGCLRPTRVQRIEPDPEYGFSHPYFLALPDSYREGPVPILVEPNNADENLSREEELKRAKNQARIPTQTGA